MAKTFNLKGAYSDTQKWQGVAAHNLVTHELDRAESVTDGRLEGLEARVSALSLMFGRLLEVCPLTPDQVVEITDSYEWVVDNRKEKDHA